ncbi:hypothetical protein CPB85DRAFT_1254465 [Mucidula mucida]|nr:hypothetical protein CPB85DRAFT_1254465 [Mucidula mucida]
MHGSGHGNGSGHGSGHGSTVAATALLCFLGEDDPHLNASSPLAYVDTEAPRPGLTLVISSEATPFTEEILASFIIQELTLERQEKISGVAYGVAYNSSLPIPVALYYLPPPEDLFSSPRLESIIGSKRQGLDSPSV